MDVVYVANDNLIELRALKNAATGAFVNNATAAVTLRDVHGRDVVGETWPLTLGYVAASDGIYRATLADTLDLVRGLEYVAHVTADGGAGLKGAWTVPLRAELRT